MKIAKSVVLLSVLLISILLPQNTFAASSTVYYPVEGTSKVVRGFIKRFQMGTFFSHEGKGVYVKRNN